MDVLFLSLLCHSLYLMIFGAEDRKQLRDSMRFVVCICSNMEYCSFFTGLAISIHAHISLLISCDVILASNYKSSKLVGFRHPVIALPAWLSSGPSRCACLDLDHTGLAY